MDTTDLLLAALAAAALSATTFAASRWWYERRLAAMAERLDKMDKARQFSQQQTLQARKQIEKLQKDLALLQKASAHIEIDTRPRSAEPGSRASADMAALLAAGDARSAGPGNGFADTLPAAHGFAATQTMPRSGFADTQAAPRHGFADTQAVPRPRAI